MSMYANFYDGWKPQIIRIKKFLIEGMQNHVNKYK